MKKNLLITGTVLAILIFISVEASSREGDFNLYMRASIDLFNGGNIYTIDYFNGYYYYYSLVFAFFLVPFTYLPIVLAQFLWGLLNVFFAYRIIKIIGGWLKTDLFTANQKWLFFICCFAFVLEFLLMNFKVGQVTICILYLALEGLRLIFEGEKLWGAVLLALSINIKLMPIVLLPYLIYRKEFRASVFVVTAYAALLILPGLVVGFARNNELLASWWHSINPLNQHHILDVDERSFHGLSTLLATLLVEKVPDMYALPIKRNIANISVEQLTWVLNGVRFMLIAFSLYFFRSRPFKAAKDNTHRFWEISYLLLIVPLIFPHQQQYGFLFIAPAACYLVYYLMQNKYSMPVIKFKALSIALVISYLACNCGLLLGVFNKYFEHFKVLTYGTLLLIPLLAICVPKKEPIGVIESVK